MKRLDIARIIIVGLISVGSFLLAQGVTFPGEPSQAPIGCLLYTSPSPRDRG